MKIASVIKDHRINSLNVLMEMSVREYLSVGEGILSKNEYQRNRVTRTSSVYSLLRKDLRELCTIPPIVLAVVKNGDRFVGKDDVTPEDVDSIFNTESVVILDGLQRTINLKEVKEDLSLEGAHGELEDFLNNKLRVEIYFGVNKLGILYRMLTLNTGQTPMSTRHQVEILYSSYIEEGIDGISLYRQIDKKTISAYGEYQFDDMIEGFNSYLDRDESGIDRFELLDKIKNLEKLSEENRDSDIFKSFVLQYNQFVLKMNEITEGWTSSTDNPSSLFGKDILHIFSKPQVIAAFGANLGSLKDKGFIEDVNSIGNIVGQLKPIPTDEIASVMENFMNVLDKVKIGAKKIGVEQRRFFKILFSRLLCDASDSYLDFDASVKDAWSRYSSLL